MRPPLPILLLDIDDSSAGTEIRLMKTPDQPEAASAALAALPNGELRLPPAPGAGDDTYLWIDALADHLNRTIPLGRGVTGIALGYEVSIDGFYVPEKIEAARNVLAHLEDPVLRDFAIRMFYPKTREDLGARDWQVGSERTVVIANGIASPLVIEMTPDDCVTVASYESPCQYHNTADERETEIAALLDCTEAPGGWLVIPIIAWPVAEFDLDETAKRHLKALAQRPAIDSAAWLHQIFWKCADQIDDPILGIQHLEGLGYQARGIPAWDDMRYRVLGGSIEDYNRHLEALQLLSLKPQKTPLLISSGLESRGLPPAPINLKGLTRNHRKVLDLILKTFRPDGYWPADFTSNRLSAFRDKPIIIEWDWPQNPSGHERMEAYSLLHAFLVDHGKTDTEAKKLLG